MLILGLGYVANTLLSLGSAKFRVTSRGGSAAGSGTREQPLYFSLTDPDSWSAVDPFDHVVWTFPAAQNESEVKLAIEFFESKCLPDKKVLVLASTSAYRVGTAGSLVDENFPLDLLQPRVRAEEQLRSRGACILHLAGIYGPGRDPVNWLQRGLIKSPDAFINLIHASDIYRIIVAWLGSNGFKFRRFNASDGRMRTWQQLIDELKSAGLLDQTFEIPSDSQSPQNVSSKRVNHEALVHELYAGPFHCYPEDGLEPA